MTHLTRMRIRWKKMISQVRALYFCIICLLEAVRAQSERACVLRVYNLLSCHTENRVFLYFTLKGLFNISAL